MKTVQMLCTKFSTKLTNLFLLTLDDESLKSLAQYNTVVDCSNKADQVDQTRDAVHTTELLVQSQHLLRVRRRVGVAPLTITGFCTGDQHTNKQA